MKAITSSRYIVPLFLCLLVLSAFSAVAVGQTKESAVPAPNAPKMVIESVEHNFGQVVSGTALTYSFKIDNTGTSDLIIKSVMPGCGCTTSNFDKIIHPGQQGKITLAIPMTDHFVGKVSKLASVQTNDSKYGNFTLTLTADFKKPATNGLSVIPGDRWSTSVIKGSSSTSEIKIINGSDNPVLVTKIVAGGTFANLRLQTVEYGRQYLIAIETDKSLKIGNYKQTATIFTDSPTKPEIPIYLDVTVTGELIVTPSAIEIAGLLSNGDLSNMDLPVINVTRARGDLKIKNVSSTISFIRTETVATQPNKVFSIRLIVDRNKIKEIAQSQFKGTIRIETNDSETPVVNIPIEGSLKMTESAAKPN